MIIRLFISLVGLQHGGLQVLSLRLAQRMKQLGHDVRLIARFTDLSHGDFGRIEKPQVFAIEGIEVEIISPSGWRRQLLRLNSPLRRRDITFPLARQLQATAWRPAIDRVTAGADIIHYFGQGVEMLGYAVLASARARRTPFLVEPAIHVDRSGYGFGDWPLYKKADMLIAHTHFETETMRAGGVEDSHIHVLRHGFDAFEPLDGSGFRSRRGITGPLVLFIGRRSYDKGYFLLLEAFALLRKRIPNATLVIAGPGSAAAATGEGVLDLGFVTYDQKRELFGACTILCVPSKGESFGMVYFEAWNCGKPVIGLDLPVLRETIGASGGGLLASLEGTDDLVAKLQLLLEQPGLASEMGTRGKKFAEGYSWEAAAQSCLGAYARAQKNRRGSL